MDYLVPAWHGFQNDWAYTVPQLEFDDATSQLRLLQDNEQAAGLLVTDYQPHLATKLGQLALGTDHVLSVFDYLQGIAHLDGHALFYQDLHWPADAFFQFDPFHLIVRRQGHRVATVIYDTQGRVIWVDYYGDDDQRGRRLLFDSRGFASRATTYDGDTAVTDTYYDELGHWRFKHDLASDRVTINPDCQAHFAHQHYAHLNALIAEVVFKHFLPGLQQEHARLVVAVDDQAVIDLGKLEDRLPTIYSVSRWHPYQQALPQLTGHLDRLVVDSQDTSDQVAQLLPKLTTAPALIPLFQAQFQLGHSQRVREQQLGLFAENINPALLNQLLELLYKRLLKRARDNKDEYLFIFTYSQQQTVAANQALEKLCQRHEGEFLLYTKKLAEMLALLDLRDEEYPELPILHIKVLRLASVADALQSLDKIRLLIDWGAVPDEFLQMVGVSMGIPQIQRVPTVEVQDHRNGLICSNLAELNPALNYYLDHLKNWNVALANDVQILNQNSSQQLLAKWQQVWKRGEH